MAELSHLLLLQWDTEAARPRSCFLYLPTRWVLAATHVLSHMATRLVKESCLWNLSSTSTLSREVLLEEPVCKLQPSEKQLWEHEQYVVILYLLLWLWSPKTPSYLHVQIVLTSSVLTAFLAFATISLKGYVHFWVFCSRQKWALKDLRPTFLSVKGRKSQSQHRCGSH